MELFIGQFNDSFPPITDGVANVVRNYSYWLERKYGRCCVVTPYAPKYQDNENFDVLRYVSVPVPGRHPYRAGLPYLDPLVRRKLRRLRFDIVHAHCPFSAGQLALRLARQRGIPIVATFHSKYYDDFLDAVKSKTAAKLLTQHVMKFYNQVDAVWTVNNSTVETMREYGYKGKVDIVPNGTDYRVNFNEIETDRKALTLVPDKPFQFLFVGQHVWHKNIRLLFEALKQIKDWNIPFEMTMVGGGKSKDGIQQLAIDLGLGEDIVFTGRISDRQALKKIYARSHLFLFPSVYDTFSLVVREAAVAGCPSLVIKDSNAAENITHGYNGLLAENNYLSYAEAIRSAVSDTGRLYEIGLNAAKTLVRSWESVIDEVAVRYSEIIKDYKAAEGRLVSR